MGPDIFGCLSRCLLQAERPSFVGQAEGWKTSGGPDVPTLYLSSILRIPVESAGPSQCSLKASGKPLQFEYVRVGNPRCDLC